VYCCWQPSGPGRLAGLSRSLGACDREAMGIDEPINAPMVQPPAQVSPPKSIRVELISDEGKRRDFIDLPYPNRLPQLSTGLMQGWQFSQTVWTGGGHMYSRNEFETQRGELIKRGVSSME
jgi:hypothetical protein